MCDDLDPTTRLIGKGPVRHSILDRFPIFLFSDHFEFTDHSLPGSKELVVKASLDRTGVDHNRVDQLGFITERAIDQMGLLRNGERVHPPLDGLQADCKAVSFVPT
ncbi:hypothetical protein D3C76_732490 [compost metagenome]